MSGPGTGYLGGWTSRDEERKTTSKLKSSASSKRYALVEHILSMKNSEEIDALYQKIFGDE